MKQQRSSVKSPLKDATAPLFAKGTHPTVVQWLRHLRSSRDHGALYEGFESLRPLLSGPSGMANGNVVARDVFAALAYEVSFVLRSYERTGSRDVFGIQSVGARYGTYELQSARQFIGECGGPHEDRIFVVAASWRQYLQRCFDLLCRLVEDQFVTVIWPERGLSQRESEWLCEPMAEKFIEGHRGCWRAFFISSLDQTRVSQMLREIGFVPPRAEERYLGYRPYPPEGSIFANPDDQTFSDLLKGAAKSRSVVARNVVSRFATDEEDWVRCLAKQILSEMDVAAVRNQVDGRGVR